MSNLEETITVIGPGRKYIQSEGLTSLPSKGMGFYDGKTFYRVVDVYFNGDLDEDGPMSYGWIVHVDLAGKDDHPLKDAFPVFYGE